MTTHYRRRTHLEKDATFLQHAADDARLLARYLAGLVLQHDAVAVDVLERLMDWLEKKARRIRLPDLLIEVDNDLRSYGPRSACKALTSDFASPRHIGSGHPPQFAPAPIKPAAQPGSSLFLRTLLQQPARGPHRRQLTFGRVRWVTLSPA